MNDFLFVCSVNRLRSATAEHVARGMGYRADSAGTDLEAAVRPLTAEAIDRAAVIVCMEDRHAKAVLRLRPGRHADVYVWNIPDEYEYGERALVRSLRQRLERFESTRASAPVAVPKRCD